MRLINKTRRSSLPSYFFGKKGQDPQLLGENFYCLDAQKKTLEIRHLNNVKIGKKIPIKGNFSPKELQKLQSLIVDYQNYFETPFSGTKIIRENLPLQRSKENANHFYIPKTFNLLEARLLHDIPTDKIYSTGAWYKLFAENKNNTPNAIDKNTNFYRVLHLDLLLDNAYLTSVIGGGDLEGLDFAFQYTTPGLTTETLKNNMVQKLPFIQPKDISVFLTHTKEIGVLVVIPNEKNLQKDDGVMLYRFARGKDKELHGFLDYQSWTKEAEMNSLDDERLEEVYQSFQSEIKKQGAIAEWQECIRWGKYVTARRGGEWTNETKLVNDFTEMLKQTLHKLKIPENSLTLKYKNGTTKKFSFKSLTSAKDFAALESNIKPKFEDNFIKLGKYLFVNENSPFKIYYKVDL